MQVIALHLPVCGILRVFMPSGTSVQRLMFRPPLPPTTPAPAVAAPPPPPPRPRLCTAACVNASVQLIDSSVSSVCIITHALNTNTNNNNSAALQLLLFRASGYTFNGRLSLRFNHSRNKIRTELFSSSFLTILVFISTFFPSLTLNVYYSLASSLRFIYTHESTVEL